MANEDPTKFDEFDSYAHFGRYEGSRGAPPPRNVFLVGRGRERAHFLDLLYMKSGLGSYLVTGVRGVGKSSFVRHCVDTYVRDVFERYCSSKVGRSFADKACVLLGLSLPLATTLTLAPVLRQLWPRAHPWPPFQGLVALGVLLLLLALGVSPGLYAYRTRNALSTAQRSKVGAWRWVYLLLPVVLALASIQWEASEVNFSAAFVPVYWLMLPLEAIALFVPLLAAYSRQRRDGLPHRDENLSRLLDAGDRLTCWRELVLGSLAATILATATRAVLDFPPNANAQWWLELLFSAVSGVLLSALILLEKLALLQPARRMVFETAIHPIAKQRAVSLEPEWVGTPPDPAEQASIDLGRAIDGTLFCALFRRWLPVLRIKINLGLDRLSHAFIVESMLRGLHQELTTTFKQPFGALNLLRWLWGGAIWLYLLHLPLPDLLLAAKIHCGDDRDPTLELLTPCSTRLADLVVPTQVDLVWAPLLAGLLLLLARGWAVLPHHAAMRELSSLLDSLSSRVVVETSTGHGKIAQAGIELGIPLRKRSVQTDPRDPHALEQAFLQILSSIRRPKLTAIPGLQLNLPAPEPIFIFDELDKVGTSTSLLTPETAAEAAYAKDERERSKKLQALLSDLKNLLGTAQARFIFVGGRNLHDEWLADEANRQPLLTNIFDAEIYLRSFLTDCESDSNSLVETGRAWVLEGPRGHARGGMHLFTSSVRRYFDAQHVRAYHAWKQWRRTTGAGRREYGLEVVAEAYVPGTARGMNPPLKKFPQMRSLVPEVALPPIDGFFWDSFIDFLTFRSRGIPRRARLILETFVRPYDRVATLKSKPRSRPAQHVLFFSDGDRVRVELVSELFRSIGRKHNGLDGRDDKVLMALFQFADFLTRFHRRAFSLQSLERFEELMHIHRAPDISIVAAGLISDWLGTLLEPTAAGIHAYRFRIEWAAEIRHLSSMSQHESASANFSLDEAQALKAQLRSQLAEVGDKGGAFEVHTALAELHDLDGDHLDARHHFRRAIEMLDARLGQEVHGGGDHGQGPVARVLASSIESAPKVPLVMERQLDWALARVRVMLQLGLTYERTFDYERAGLEYGNALQVARAIWRSEGALLSTLKSNATMLLEPIFAQAWSILKDPVVTESPWLAARDWLTELLVTGEDREKSGEDRWRCILSDNRDPLGPRPSRELNMLGDLAFFCAARWPDSVSRARQAYEAAARVAAQEDYEQQARSALSLAFCDLLDLRNHQRLYVSQLEGFVRHLGTAQLAAVAARSSQGPFADSMAIHHLGLELIEEIWRISAASLQHERASPRRRWKKALFDLIVSMRGSSGPAHGIFDEPPGHFEISGLRERVLNDARWRLRALHPAWASYVPKPYAFPARNRLLNFRSELLEGNESSRGFERLVRMWRRFDSRSTIAPCRIAIAAPESEAARSIWEMSLDISHGGKHFFGWLRDRYYLDDGFGPMLLRANFALTLGFSKVHARFWSK